MGRSRGKGAGTDSIAPSSRSRQEALRVRRRGAHFPVADLKGERRLLRHLECVEVVQDDRYVKVGEPVDELARKIAAVPALGALAGELRQRPPSAGCCSVLALT